MKQLLADRYLERVQGALADGRSWLDRARQALEAARLIADAAPDSSIILAYDAARHAWVALLAQQGLRPTTADGPKAVDDAIRAQVGASLRAFGGLRRRRNELEYPDYPTEKASAGQAAEALQTASEIIDAVARFLPTSDSSERLTQQRGQHQPVTRMPLPEDDLRPTSGTP